MHDLIINVYQVIFECNSLKVWVQPETNSKIDVIFK